jgi:hypothetical protein
MQEFYNYTDDLITISVPSELTRRGKKRWTFKSDARRHKNVIINQFVVSLLEADFLFDAVRSYILGVQPKKHDISILRIVEQGSIDWADKGAAVLTAHSTTLDGSLLYRYDIISKIHGTGAYCIFSKHHKHHPYTTINDFKNTCEIIAKSIKTNKLPLN